MTATELLTLNICDRDHGPHYPAALEDFANSQALDLGFCLQCDCGTVAFAIMWAGDGLRIMERGDLELYAGFESAGWQEIQYTDGRGIFLCRAVPALGYAQFVAERRDRAES